MNTPKSLAILGGTFDPIHNGHIESAKHVAQWLGIEQVNLMPAHLPPHKENVSATAKQRAKMVELVCYDEPLLVCDQRELNRSSLSYTFDTLKEIKQQYPQTTLYFIIGMDSLLSFTQWHKWQEILTLCHLVVNCRPNYLLTNLSQKNQLLLEKYQLDQNINSQLLKEQSEKASVGYILFSPEINLDISSTSLRDKIKAQQSWQSDIPTKVLNYINQQQLYQ